MPQEMKERRRICSQNMVMHLQKLFAKLLLTNQKYVDPSQVVNSVVDDFGRKIDVGSQMDVVEYLLNFIERLEEGLDEAKQPASEDSTQFQSDISLDLSIGVPIDEPEDFKFKRFASYMENVAPVDALPLRAREYKDYTDTIKENFFGEQTMVTKLVNKVSNNERLLSRIKERLGPIMLKLKHGNLVDDWQESSRDQVDDYKVEKSKII
jgi:Ubiquitin carboxyl-terminal hydrolase